MLSAGSLRIETFEGSRPDLAGQVLVGYSIDKVIRSRAELLRRTCDPLRVQSSHIAVALPKSITRSVRRSAASLRWHAQLGGQSPANLMEVNA